MDADGTLNIFEQRPFWERLVSNIALCFQLSEAADTTAITATLQAGFEGLASGFPWVAGQVINEGRNLQDGNSGVFKIVPRSERPKIIVKDHTQTPSVPSMQSLRQAGYAFALLDEAVFAPRPAFTLIPPSEKAVFLIQANFVTGGLVLVFSGAHAVMDGPGQAQLLRWFSKACHNEAYTAAELEVGNMSRRNMIPLLDSTYQPGEELTPQIPLTPTAGLVFPRVPCTWATFQIPSQSVVEIKATASVTRTTAYLSSDDALSAFVWQAVARARLHRLDPSTTSTAGRAINARQAVGVPPDYPGLLQHNLFHPLTLHELTTLPLGATASLLRSSLISTNPSLTFSTRALATALSRSPDKSAFRITANTDLSTDLLLSSSNVSGAYHLDFAMGHGPAEAVRLTRQVTFESMAYLLLTASDGEATVALCLRDADLAALVADEAFGKHARHVG